MWNQVLLSAVAFFILGVANDKLFSDLAYSYGVNWIFLPSGLRLALVLLFDFWGAAGVVLGSLALNMVRMTEWPVGLAASLISGLSPWLAGLVCLRAFKIQSDLSNLGARQLLQMALIFALLSAALHQILYAGAALSESFIKGTLVMATGDLLGSLLVLYALKLGLALLRR